MIICLESKQRNTPFPLLLPSNFSNYIKESEFWNNITSPRREVGFFERAQI